MASDDVRFKKPRFGSVGGEVLSYLIQPRGHERERSFKYIQAAASQSKRGQARWSGHSMLGLHSAKSGDVCWSHECTTPSLAHRASSSSSSSHQHMVSLVRNKIRWLSFSGWTPALHLAARCQLQRYTQIYLPCGGDRVVHY